MYIFPPIVGYLVGSIPFGLIIGKMVGVDVRTKGSQNIGATNVGRLLGKKLGVLVLICDCLKGLLSVYLTMLILPETEAKEMIVAFTGVMVVLGHMFPIYLKFRGGKGVATALGVFLCLSLPAIGISLVVFVAAVAITGFVSVGSLLASGLIPLWLYLFGAPKAFMGAAVCIALLIWCRHHANIKRLMRGEEKTWNKVKNTHHN